jgi:hypothetical protein
MCYRRIYLEALKETLVRAVGLHIFSNTKRECSPAILGIKKL